MATIWLAIPDDEKREYFEHDLPPILPGHTFEFAYMASALPDEGSPDAIVLDVGGMAGNFGNPHFSRLHTDYALRQYPSATLLVLLMRRRAGLNRWLRQPSGACCSPRLLMAMDNAQRGLCGCEDCEFYERRVAMENDENCYYCRCEGCCRFDTAEPEDRFLRRMVHRGLFHDRTEGQCSDIERALAVLWEKECSAHKHAALGFDATKAEGANDLLRTLLTRGATNPPDGKTGRIEVTQDIATACADIVQWMGTNCGLSFLIRAFRDAGYTLSYRMQPGGDDDE